MGEELISLRVFIWEGVRGGEKVRYAGDHQCEEDSDRLVAVLDVQQTQDFGWIVCDAMDEMAPLGPRRIAPFKH